MLACFDRDRSKIKEPRWQRKKYASMQDIHLPTRAGRHGHVFVIVIEGLGMNDLEKAMSSIGFSVLFLLVDVLSLLGYQATARNVPHSVL
jgi:hypothetical protein